MVQKEVSTTPGIRFCIQPHRYSSIIIYACFGGMLGFFYYSTRKEYYAQLPKTNIEAVSINWVKQLRTHSRKVFSQAGQDGIIEEIFNHVDAKNKKFVEFGFGYAKGEQNITGALHGTNTFYLTKKGWRGWLFDALIELKSIGLHRELLSPATIVQTFKKHNIPKDVDYISIDVDSIDLWLFQSLVKNGDFAPQVISIEYNANFPYGSTATCDSSWEPWRGDVVYGASIGAVLHVASRAGYFPVHVEGALDVFLVKQEALSKTGGRGFSVDEMETLFPLPRKAHGFNNNSRLNRFVDYRTFEKTGDMEIARKASENDLRLLRKFHGVY